MVAQTVFPWFLDDPRPAPPPRKRRGRFRYKRALDIDSIEFNQAIWRIVEKEYEDGGIYEQLAIVTGLTVEALWMRKSRIENGPHKPKTLSCRDLTYFHRRYQNSKNPEIREWLSTITHQPRRRKRASRLSSSDD